jgi:hypothetical protein
MCLTFGNPVITGKIKELRTSRPQGHESFIVMTKIKEEERVFQIK